MNIRNIKRIKLFPVLVKRRSAFYIGLVLTFTLKSTKHSYRVGWGWGEGAPLKLKPYTQHNHSDYLDDKQLRIWGFSFGHLQCPQRTVDEFNLKYKISNRKKQLLIAKYKGDFVAYKDFLKEIKELESQLNDL